MRNSKFYGSIDEIFDVFFSELQPGKEAQMGKPVKQEAKSSAPARAVAFCLRQNKEDYKVEAYKQEFIEFVLV